MLEAKTNVTFLITLTEPKRSVFLLGTRYRFVACSVCSPTRTESLVRRPLFYQEEEEQLGTFRHRGMLLIVRYVLIRPPAIFLCRL